MEDHYVRADALDREARRRPRARNVTASTSTFSLAERRGNGRAVGDRRRRFDAHLDAIVGELLACDGRLRGLAVKARAEGASCISPAT